MTKVQEKITLRLYADRDQDLLAWLEDIPNQHGAKSLAAKKALRKGIGVVEASFDVETFVQELAPHLERMIGEMFQRMLGDSNSQG
jgi:hypothetical protein